jgi:type II secretory pathway component PulF
LSALETEETPLIAAEQRPRARLRRIGAILLTAFITQYLIVALIVGLLVAATLRYFVTPQIVATYEALAAALKR